jgi:hypothetical protein
MVTTQKSNGSKVMDLLKVLVGLLIWTGLIVAAAFWISPVLGSITALFAAFVWTFFIAPRLAGQMVAALIIYFREKRQGN